MPTACIYRVLLAQKFAMIKSQIPALYVIGTVSQDVLHLPNTTVVHSPGGAGLYTALAAQNVGTPTGLFAPKPTPVPKPMQSIHSFLIRWDGPSVIEQDLPHLEIKHHGAGKATLIDASWGAETLLTPEIMPAELFEARYVHIAALSSAQRQLDFLNALKHTPCQISVGTYARLVYNSPVTVQKIFQAANLFFMNENEAIGLFGHVQAATTKPGRLLFITLAAQGALVIEADQITRVAGHPVEEVDPTGAGDTFCGAVLAGLAQGLSPVQAAEQAVKLAAQTVATVGPAILVR